MNIFEKDSEFIAHTYGRTHIEFVKGKGSFLYDSEGREYIDFGTGIAVNGLGISNSKWVEAVKNQLDTLSHTSNLYYTSPQADLAELLCERTGMKKVFFANSGAEANECAIKVARKYYYDKTKKSNPEIITLISSFHGRTIATLKATGQDTFHQFFDPFPNGFTYAKANDIDDVKQKINDNTAAIFFELVQGEGGVRTLDKEFVTQVASLCKEKDILLMIDEVQTGNGRSGTLYAFEQFDIVPDVITTAKGLGNGLPIGACLMGEKVSSTLTPGTHGSTFGGNPIACAGALAIIKQIDEDLLNNVKENAKIIKEELSTCKKVKSISGLGLMIGIEVDDNKKIISECLEKGLVVLSAKTKVRLLPPLNMDKETLYKGLKILKEVLE